MPTAVSGLTAAAPAARPAAPRSAEVASAGGSDAARSVPAGQVVACTQTLAVTLALDPSSDPDGNGVVTGTDFAVVGQTSPGARVRLTATDGSLPAQRAVADAQGNFRFQLSAGVGIYPLRVVAVDSAGDRATARLAVTRGDVVVDWDQTAMNAIRAEKNNVGLASRTLAMVSTAMCDAINDITGQCTVYKAAVAAPPGASPEAAAAAAAYTVLVGEYPGLKGLFDATLAESLATVGDPSARDAGVAVGQEVGQMCLNWRAGDGSDVQVPYVPGTQPGDWQPTPPGYTTAWGPEWGQVAMFALPSAGPFLPPPPPPMTSAEYAAAFNEVAKIGAKDSPTRTATQTLIGAFWAYDSAAVGPPIIRFQQVAQAVALEQHNTLAQNARMFALADLAMADAAVVAWDTKYTYNRWRPITAIQLADTVGNPNTPADPYWQPLGAPGDGGPNFTPPFPSYVSGHATLGGALFTTLADFYGTDAVTFTIGSDEVPGVTRTYTSFSRAAAENAASRIYLGIHFRFDETNGQASGTAIANYVFQHLMTPVSPGGTAP